MTEEEKRRALASFENYHRQQDAALNRAQAANAIQGSTPEQPIAQKVDSQRNVTREQALAPIVEQGKQARARLISEGEPTPEQKRIAAQRALKEGSQAAFNTIGKIGEIMAPNPIPHVLEAAAAAQSRKTMNATASPIGEMEEEEVGAQLPKKKRTIFDIARGDE